MATRRTSRPRCPIWSPRRSVRAPAKLKRLADREAAVWRNADGYVTITHGLADELVERFGARERVAVVPDGMRLPDRDPRRRCLREPIVGYAGHLYAWKGVDALLQSLSRRSPTRAD